MTITVIPVTHEETLSRGLAQHLKAEYCPVEIHHFPDGETRVRVTPDKINREIVIVASLHQPDSITLPLLFISETLREYGAKDILLVAPYLPYMRQDKRFHEGEGISARYYARLISDYFDELITVDPHLHRIRSLEDIYSIPVKVVHAAPSVAEWIENNIEQPLLIGPDSESKQWVEDIAGRANAPFVILEKIRYSDKDVKISVPQVNRWVQHTPVLVDDIISSGRTMIETAVHLQQAGLKAPVCIGVHGIFAGDACQELNAAGISRIVTSNTIPHNSNFIDLTQAIINAIKG